MKKKVLMYLGIFTLIYAFNFFIFRLMPGDPLDFASSDMDSNSIEMAGGSNYKYLQEYYGLDKKVHIQFLDTVKANIKGDFGQSIFYRQSVKTLIQEKLPWTLYMVFSSSIISLALGILLAFIGIKYKTIDNVLYTLLNLISEVPSFLIGVLLLFTLAVNIDFFPLAGGFTPFKEHVNIISYLLDILRYSILPIMCLVIVNVGDFYLTARASFIEIINKDYILTAKAKGLKELRILLYYILKNSFPPILNKFFISIGFTLSGALLVENIFAYPGIGKLLKDAVLQRDYILIQGIFLVSTTFVLISNMVADFINQKNIDKEGC